MSIETEMVAYIRSIRNAEKRRYAKDYIASWLLGAFYPNAEDYTLSTMARQAVAIRVSDIIMAARNAAKFRPTSPVSR